MAVQGQEDIFKSPNGQDQGVVGGAVDHPGAPPSPVKRWKTEEFSELFIPPPSSRPSPKPCTGKRIPAAAPPRPLPLGVGAAGAVPLGAGMRGKAAAPSLGRQLLATAPGARKCSRSMPPAPQRTGAGTAVSIPAPASGGAGPLPSPTAHLNPPPAGTAALAGAGAGRAGAGGRGPGRFPVRQLNRRIQGAVKKVCSSTRLREEHFNEMAVRRLQALGGEDAIRACLNFVEVKFSRRYNCGANLVGTEGFLLKCISDFADGLAA